VAYYFHWSHDEILGMPHWERQRWCQEISRINEEMNAEGQTELPDDPRVEDIPVVDMDEQFGSFGEE
jgi:hypothetical protein